MSIKKRDQFLPFSPPSIGNAEIDEVVDTLKSGWLTTGPKVKRFEEDFKKYTSAENALALSSGTAALQVGMAALGVGSGDLVISTPMTFCSGVMSIEDVGAEPLLVDINAKTLNIDVSKVRQVLESMKNRSAVKAIMPVHFAGLPCEMKGLLSIAKEFNLKIIEDAAHAVGAQCLGKNVGSIGDLTAFSFYVTKNMTTGEGGMLTGNQELVEKARIMSLHGISKDAWKRYSQQGSWYYEVVDRGFKSNMSDIQAALGIQQLKRLPEFQKRRAAIAATYTKAFAQLGALEVPEDGKGMGHAWHLYILKLHLDQLNINRTEFIEKLKEYNVGASVHFIPVHLHPYFQNRFGFTEDSFPVAKAVYERMFSIPLYPSMTDEDVQYVIDVVTEIVKDNKK